MCLPGTLVHGLHRRLMIRQREPGNYADAFKSYWRCRELLSIVLRKRPTEETPAVYRS
jgi:hypothetical protein